MPPWGPTWLDDMSKHTELWTASEATEFLNSLQVAEFPISHILTILKNTQSLQRIQQQLNNSEFQTSSDVFIHYVRNHFREKLHQEQPSLEGISLEEAIEDLMLSQMPSRRNKPPWEERIYEDAQNWSVLDATLFLDELESEWDIDIDTIMKRLNSTSFFSRATYIQFTSRLEVYIEYFDKNPVKKILQKTFIPFEKGDTENIRAMLDRVFTYFDFEKDLMVEILSNNLQVISSSNLDLLERKTEWLEDFLGRGDRARGKKEIKSIVREKKSLHIIHSIGIKLNRKTDEYENETEFRVSFLKTRGGYTQEAIIDLFKNNSQAFSEGDISPHKISYLEELLTVTDTNGNMRNGQTELNEVIQNGGFHGIVTFKIYKDNKGDLTNEYVEFLKKRKLTRLQIADIFKSNPSAFSRGDLSPHKISYLEELLMVTDTNGRMRNGQTELDWVIQNKSFLGIVVFKIYKDNKGDFTNEYVEFLKKRKLTRLQIADIFRSSPQAFSRGDLSPHKISYLEELLTVTDTNGRMRNGQTELDWVIQKNFEGIVAFKIYKDNKSDFTNEYVEFLKKRGLTPLQIADLFKSNPHAFSKGNISPHKISYLEELLTVTDTNGRMRNGQTELGWVIQNKSFYGIVAFKIYKDNEGDFTNEYVEFLEKRGLTRLQIADIFKSNPNAFSRGDISPHKISYLEELLTVTDTNGRMRNGQTELGWVIQNKSFYGIVAFKIYKDNEGDFTNEYVEFLEKRGLTRLQIADIFKSNPNAFSRGDISPHKISYLEELLTVIDTNGDMRNHQTELDWAIQNGGFQGIVDFKIYKDNKGDFTNEYVEFLKKRGLTPLQIADLFKSNPRAFSKGDLSDDKITYLEDLLTVTDTNGTLRNGQTELDKVIQNKSFAGIVTFKTYKDNKGESTNEYVEFLKKRGLTPLQIADLFKSNPQAFSAGDISFHKITYLEDLLTVTDTNGRMRNGQTELDKVIQNKSFAGIVTFKTYKDNKGESTNEYVEFLKKRGLTPLQIADLFKSNPQAFSKGNISPHKISYLEELLTVADTNGKIRNGKTELDEVIQNGGFYGIVTFKIYKEDDPKNYVEFLKKRGLTPLQIADLFKSNPYAFSRGDLSPHKISYLEEYLGKGDRNIGKKKLDHIILKKGGFKALVLFEYNINAQPANTIIDFLENGMHFNQDQVVKIMEDHFSKLFTEELTEDTSEGYIERLMERVPDICQKSLLQNKAS